MIWPAIGAVLGVASAGLGIAQGAQSDASERRAVKAQNDYNKDVYEYEWDEYIKEFEHAKKGQRIQQRNQEDQLQYGDDSAARRYGYDLAINQYAFQTDVKQYNRSVANYEKNLEFNNLAAAAAYQQESRRFDDIATETRFTKQNQEIALIQAQGASRARGVSGRSAGRAKQMNLAGHGRNMAILERQLTVAKQQSKANLSQIASQKYGADIQAFGDVLLSPTKQPDVPQPYSAPRPEWQELLKRDKPPEPMKGVAKGGGLLGGIGNAVGSLSSIAFQMPTGPSQNII